MLSGSPTHKQNFCTICTSPISNRSPIQYLWNYRATAYQCTWLVVYVDKFDWSRSFLTIRNMSNKRLAEYLLSKRFYKKVVLLRDSGKSPFLVRLSSTVVVVFVFADTTSIHNCLVISLSVWPILWRNCLLRYPRYAHSTKQFFLSK